MAWETITINVDGKNFTCHAQGSTFSIPCSSNLEVGNSFKVGACVWEVTEAIDVAQRNEILLINAKEVKNDKSKKGRNEDKSGGKDVELQSNNGRTSKN
tara:strand:- start:938 stop:1234 length:297 start_codon:yes stop_codon:yes gene_type:complete